MNWHTTALLFASQDEPAASTLQADADLRARSFIKGTVMNKAAPSHRWFAGWRAGVQRPPQDDPADLGTAFGLDMSLNELAHEPVTSATAHRPGWVKRLATRRKPSA